MMRWYWPRGFLNINSAVALSISVIPGSPDDPIAQAMSIIPGSPYNSRCSVPCQAERQWWWESNFPATPTFYNCEHSSRQIWEVSSDILSCTLLLILHCSPHPVSSVTLGLWNIVHTCLQKPLNSLLMNSLSIIKIFQHNQVFNFCWKMGNCCCQLQRSIPKLFQMVQLRHHLKMHLR